MDHRIRSIVHLSPSFLPSLGGVERHLSEVTSIHQKEGYRTTVITIQSKETEALEEIVGGVTVIRIPKEYKDNKIGMWKWMWLHKNYFTDSIVHVHDVAWWTVPLIPILYKKFFIIFHGWEGKYPVPVKNKLHRFLFASFAKKTIHVGEYIQKFYWDKPTKVTYGGVTVQKTENSNSENTKLTSFLFIGRLEKENEIKKYCQFLDLCKKNDVNFSVIWVGDGALKNQAKKYGKVTGMIDDFHTVFDDINFVFANSYLSILEAQIQGKIVCSFYSHPLKEAYLKLFPGSNYMLIAREPQELFDELEKLKVDSNQRKNLSTQAKKFAATQSWERVAQLYEELWAN